MAITKVSYTRSKTGAKASLDYYTHRPDRAGERTTRELFGEDGQLSKRHGYLLIDRARADTVFLRIALSPDPNLEDAKHDLNLRELTEQTIARLQKLLKQKQIQYIATEHTDQTEIRHTHIIALVAARHLSRGQLSLADLEALRGGATGDAASMRLTLDQATGVTRTRAAPEQTPAPAVPERESGKQRHQPPQARSIKQPSVRSKTPQRSYGGTRPQPPRCPNCGSNALMHRRGRFFACPACGLEVRHGLGLGLEMQTSLGLELFLEEVGGV